MPAITTKNVLLVTGAFVTHHSRGEWVAYVNSKNCNAIKSSLASQGWQRKRIEKPSTQ